MSVQDCIYDGTWPPGGLMCPTCEKTIKVGERYSQVLIGMHDEIPGVVIVCWDCGLTPGIADEVGRLR